eukprot:TRINITY_DN25368_c0_g1_i1.p1 TRINITY_DN25368_c0_g1~~TRINITY_DN25368_c0_g1_i1.p1  ORF type:complete len:560 (+),score=92.36 TRINITY_DN25368_c0_g1_i1:109-1680(+)
MAAELGSFTTGGSSTSTSTSYKKRDQSSCDRRSCSESSSSKSWALVVVKGTLPAVLAVLYELEADWADQASSIAAVFGRTSCQMGVVSASSPAISAFRNWAGSVISDDSLQTGDKVGQRQSVASLLQDLQETAWTRIHAKAKAAPAAPGPNEGGEAQGPWREAFGACCLMRCCAMLGDLGMTKDVAGASTAAEDALKLLDLGIIIAGPEARASSALFESAGCVSEVLASLDSDDGASADSLKRQRLSGDDVQTNALLAQVFAPYPAVKRPMKEVIEKEGLSLEKFLLHFLADRSPVVVRGGCKSWPAFSRWANRDFWLSGAIGRRFVPVEMDYWFDHGYKLMDIRNFVKHCIEAENLESPPPGLSGGGYIAQHALLDQIPSLGIDAPTPDLALCGPEGSLLRQLFFGPRGTVTPVHYDPYENIFCQVVGAKYLRLYPPSEAPCLYARSSEDTLRNNSMLEPADILEGEAAGSYGGENGRFPKLFEAKYVDVIVEPGDLLYLPKGWWHFVKSLSTSISVAFHFN